jgi:hypothetical protein
MRGAKGRGGEGEACDGEAPWAERSGEGAVGVGGPGAFAEAWVDGDDDCDFAGGHAVEVFGSESGLCLASAVVGVGMELAEVLVFGESGDEGLDDLVLSLEEGDLGEAAFGGLVGEGAFDDHFVGEGVSEEESVGFSAIDLGGGEDDGEEGLFRDVDFAVHGIGFRGG